MAGIFISYRRDENSAHARAVWERLCRELGREHVFMDVDGIEPGEDFVDHIEQQLNGCVLMLVLIDERWHSGTDRHGRQRLALSNDFVRLEVLTALGRKIKVVPVLIDDTPMPLGEHLPAELHGLLRRQAMELDFRRHTEAALQRLVEVARRVLQSSKQASTRDAGGSPSLMSYSPGQIDEIGGIDPVAEADVYLAYGRDLMAEEILKEAMRANPDRLAIRTKLLEVYAKRHDIKGFELLADELYGLTGGQGEEWVKAQDLGRSINPENPIYKPKGMKQRRRSFGSSADRLARQIDLAEEFRQIGDLQGARDLLREVIEKADGTLKARAQSMLDHLS